MDTPPGPPLAAGRVPAAARGIARRECRGRCRSRCRVAQGARVLLPLVIPSVRVSILPGRVSDTGSSVAQKCMAPAEDDSETEATLPVHPPCGTRLPVEGVKDVFDVDTLGKRYQIQYQVSDIKVSNTVSGV